jgi:hypothetical protein
MISEGDCGAIGGMKIGRGNQSTRRKPAPAPLRPPQIPLDKTRDRTRAAVVGSQWLTAWAMAQPISLNVTAAHMKSPFHSLIPTLSISILAVRDCYIALGRGHRKHCSFSYANHFHGNVFVLLSNGLFTKQCVRDMVWRKQPKVLTVGTWNLHHDDTPAHTALSVQEFKAMGSIPVLPQLPCSLYSLLYSPN